MEKMSFQTLCDKIDNAILSLPWTEIEEVVNQILSEANWTHEEFTMALATSMVS